MLIKIKRSKKYFTVVGAVLLLASTGLMDAMAEQPQLTASTSLTIVNVTQFLHSSADITTWPAYPQTPVAPKTAVDIGGPTGQELYIYKVDFYPHQMEWFTYPSPTPYGRFPNGLSSMVAAVWSQDGGKTFKLQSWDYLRPTTGGKGLEEGMPNCWMGTIVHALCDRKAGECNGRNRSNLMFEEYPSGATGCWGAAVMK